MPNCGIVAKVFLFLVCWVLCGELCLAALPHVVRRGRPEPARVAGEPANAGASSAPASTSAASVVGGTDNGVGNVTPAAEYNFYADPEAAKIVVNAGFNLSIATWTLTLKDGLWTTKQLDALDALGTDKARFFTDVNRASLAFARETEGLDGSLHPDALTCAIALDEGLILEAETCVVDVETVGELTRGYLSVSHAILPDIEIADPALKRRPPNARVIKAIDREGFFAAMRTALL